MKVCSRCKEEKPLESFGYRDADKRLLRSQCGQCRYARKRELHPLTPKVKVKFQCVTHKICPHCKKDKLIEEFAPKGNDGYQSWCRECTKAYKRGEFCKKEKLETLPLKRRICKCCEENKSVSRFRPDRVCGNSITVSNQCTECISKIEKDRRNEVKKYVKKCVGCGTVKLLALFTKSNRESVNKFCKRCYNLKHRKYHNKRSNKEKAKRSSLEATKKARINLEDFYVKDVLAKRGIDKRYMTPQLIDLFRVFLKLKRAIKEMKK